MRNILPKILVLSLVILLSTVFLIGCTQPKPEDQVCIPKTPSPAVVLEGNNVTIVSVQELTPNQSEIISNSNQENTNQESTTPISNPTTTTQEPIVADRLFMKDGVPTIEATEGQIVDITLKAIDPDKDNLLYTYSKPFNANGTWKTKIGDAGSYFATITASDGKAETTQKVQVIVNVGNRPPKISKMGIIYANEGETIKLNPTVTDPQNMPVTITYSDWMNSNTKVTTYGDAGEYFVTITATNGITFSSEDIKIIIAKTNRAPVLGEISDITVNEGEIAKVSYFALDADKDPLTVTFSKPFNKDGVWKTVMGDAGSYAATVTVTDGKLTDTKAFKLTVVHINRAPSITNIGTITVKEGETVKFNPIVNDLDNDPVTVTYSGWMTSNTYTTIYGDAGLHEVYLTASDGKASTKITALVTVLHVNRPPVFVLPSN